MTIFCGVGQNGMLDGRDAAVRALYQAIERYQGRELSLVIVFVSHEYDMNDVLGGLSAQLGTTPLIGFSTSAELTHKGANYRSVVVAALGGDDLTAKSGWVPSFSDNPQRAMERLLPMLEMGDTDEGLLLTILDGLSHDGVALCQNLPVGKYALAGGLSGGDINLGRSFQFGGNQAGSGGLSAAFLKGEGLKIGIGTAHGWTPVGVSFKVTLSRGQWIRSLDGRTAAERYADFFGKSGRDWAFPPLNNLIRLYPLGFEQYGRDDLTVRSPLRVETDGSLLMNSEVEDGSLAHLLVGSVKNCENAARRAAKTALDQLGKTKPKLAIVLVDIAWEMLLKSNTGAEIDAIQSVIGDSVPLAGGYTFGQFAHMKGSRQPELLNQYLQIILIG